MVEVDDSEWSYAHDTGRGLSGGVHVRELAARLLHSHETGRSIPIETAFAELSSADAYLVQDLVTASIARDGGERPVGWKLSGTDGPVPLSGVLFASTFLPDGHAIGCPAVDGPLVEPEVVFRIERPVKPGATPGDWAASVVACAALEVPRSRLAGWWPRGQSPAITREALVADNAVAHRVVTGGVWHTLSVEEHASAECVLTLPDGTTRTGSAESVFGSPLNALAWLAEELRKQRMDLPVGALVSTGTFTVPVHASLGKVTAEFSHVGSVSTRFVEEKAPEHS